MIVIDPGHGARDVGAVGPTGLRERDIVWSWAKALRYLLRIQGLEAEYTHQREWGLWAKVKYPNSWRPKEANKRGAVMLSLHINASVLPDADYTLVLHNGHGEAAVLAEGIAAQLKAATGNSKATTKTIALGERGAGLILPVVKPAFILEPCFLSCLPRETWLRQHSNVVGLAKAVAALGPQLVAPS